MNLPRFETERLILKEITLDDAASYQKHFADYEVISQLSHHVPWPYPSDGAKTFIEKSILRQQGKDHWIWGLFLKTNPSEIIGAIDLKNLFLQMQLKILSQDELKKKPEQN